MDLNPTQRDLVLKVAELLVGKEECDSRAEFWVDKAAKLLPGNPAVFTLKVGHFFLLLDGLSKTFKNKWLFVYLTLFWSVLSRLS